MRARIQVNDFDVCVRKWQSNATGLSAGECGSRMRDGRSLRKSIAFAECDATSQALELCDHLDGQWSRTAVESPHFINAVLTHLRVTEQRDIDRRNRWKVSRTIVSNRFEQSFNVIFRNQDLLNSDPCSGHHADCKTINVEKGDD